MADEREQALAVHAARMAQGDVDHACGRCFNAGYDAAVARAEQAEKANEYLRGQVFRGPGACYCVCHNPLSSCGYCQHCKGDNSVGEFHRLRALLGEALTALHHVETVVWLDCCRNAIAPVLAKLAKEKIK